MPPVFWRLVCLSLILVPLVTHAQTAAELQQKINTHNAQIKVLQAQIAEFQKQTELLGKQKNTLQSTIDSLTVSQKQLTAQIAVTENKISSANLELERLTIAIGNTADTIADNQIAIGKSLRTVAEREGDPLIAQLLRAGTLIDAWRVADDMNQFNQAVARDIEALRVAKQSLSENRDAVAATKSELVALQNDLTEQKKSVDLNKRAQQKLLTETKSQESVYQKLLADKKAEEASFEAALFDLASQLEYALDPSKIPKTGKGVLRWPLDDVRITQQFGQTSSSGRLYTSGTHNGVDFRAAIGTPVRSSATGVVLETNEGTAPNCQYGKWVLVKHNNGLATLYAHLSEIVVQKNMLVSMGQLVGYSGNTGYATGPHLHLGVFFADAISFRQYTCKNGRAVTIPIAPVRAYLDPLSYL